MSDAPTSVTISLADRYTIERILGQGGMATVHLAEERKHKRKVAIKVLKPEWITDVAGRRICASIQSLILCAMSRDSIRSSKG